MSNFLNITFHPHTLHNPGCDILQGQIDQDCIITYVKYVKGESAGKEALEMYRGANYVPGSTRRNYSKHLVGRNIKNSEYYELWKELKLEYENKYQK